MTSKYEALISGIILSALLAYSLILIERNLDIERKAAKLHREVETI